MPILTTVTQQSIGSPSHSSQTKEIKGIHIGREEVKLRLYANDILYIENLRTQPKTTRTDNKFSKVAGCKINIQKSVAFPYINNEILEKE